MPCDKGFVANKILYCKGKKNIWSVIGIDGGIMNNELKGGRRIEDWRPEDEQFWANGGKQAATRNLWISIPNLLIAFSDPCCQERRKTLGRLCQAA